MAYCSNCDHPTGYEDPARGCTMPLNSHGDPVGPNEETALSCGCRYQAGLRRAGVEGDHPMAQAIIELNEWLDELHPAITAAADPSYAKAKFIEEAINRLRNPDQYGKLRRLQAELAEKQSEIADLQEEIRQLHGFLGVN